VSTQEDKRAVLTTKNRPKQRVQQTGDGKSISKGSDARKEHSRQSYLDCSAEGSYDEQNS
jgi:hypothetical protein